LGRLFQKAFDYKVSRRSFIKGSAITAAGIGLLGKGSGLNKVSDAFAQEVAEKEEKWVNAACWGDCGSKGFNKVYAVDGIPLRMGTDETTTDDPLNPRVKSCPKGRALRDYIFAPSRLKYPMKRKNWEPGGGDKSLRGRDEWVRISWDEALDIVAGEIKRIVDSYGNSAIFGMVRAYIDRLLSAYGGYTSYWGSSSAGSWEIPWGTGIFGFNGIGFNDRLDWQNTKTFVLWGYNPVWSRAGIPMQRFMQCKNNGAKFIFVDPFYNPSAQVLADDWIPIRPATDHAFILGVMYALLEEDVPGIYPLVDWDFLNRCTVGFDADHMPAGADPKENFKDYVLGTYDGIPKTPEWASAICGTDPARIRAFAKEIGVTNDVAIVMSCAPARVNNSDSFPQAVMALTAMTGHIGKPGNFVAQDVSHLFMAEGRALVTGSTMLGATGYKRATPIPNPLSQGLLPAFAKYPGPNTPATVIAMTEMWDAILTGKYTAGYNDIRNIDIKMIYNQHRSYLNQMPGTLKGIEAFRKVEFVVTQNLNFCPEAQYSDVVLPVTSQWERYGLLDMGYREHILWSSQVIEPFFEAKDDDWIAEEIGVRLGLDPKTVRPWPIKQEIINNVADAMVINQEGTGYEHLVTITEKDLQDLGAEGVPQAGRIPIMELKERGIFKLVRHPGDNYVDIPFKEFRESPEANPIATSKSGKWEIHCQAWADTVKNFGWTEIPPIPKYSPPIEGYEDTFADWKNKIKGDFPLQKTDLHILRRSHSSMDSTPYLRELFPIQLVMNNMDAEQRGIKDGDTVLVSSRHGKVLRIATVTARMMPGVVGMAQGSWLNFDEGLGVDKGGCANVLCGAISTGQGHKGWNSVNIQIEKWTGEPLPPDVNAIPKFPV